MEKLQHVTRRPLPAGGSRQLEFRAVQQDLEGLASPVGSAVASGFDRAGRASGARSSWSKSFARQSMVFSGAIWW